jgi:excisionase family DNA binding protein
MKKEAKRVIVSPLGQMYSTDEVAQILNISRRTVQRMIRNGELVAIGKQRHYKITEEELRGWKERELAKGTVRAEQARGAEAA